MIESINTYYKKIIRETQWIDFENMFLTYFSSLLLKMTFVIGTQKIRLTIEQNIEMNKCIPRLSPL